MILTDFVCWIPFIIICALHNAGGIDATNWYVNLALIVLPINSVINPLVSDNTLQEYLKRCVDNMVKTKARVPSKSYEEDTTYREDTTRISSMAHQSESAVENVRELESGTGQNVVGITTMELN